MKRFLSFRKDKKSGAQVNGASNGSVNGINGVNIAHGINGIVSAGMNGVVKNRIAEKTEEQIKADQADRLADSDTIAQTFEKFAQLIHATRRPLPTQTGDGTYIEHEVKPSLFQDLRSLGFKDVNTLMQVMRTKGKHQDDKTMIMERIIHKSPNLSPGKNIMLTYVHNWSQHCLPSLRLVLI
jgi:hypothetical protein